MILLLKYNNKTNICFFNDGFTFSVFILWFWFCEFCALISVGVIWFVIWWASGCWGQIFHTTWLYFISDLHHFNIIMDFGKISFKAQKSPYSHKKASKLMVQAQGTSFHFLAHDLSSWVSSGEFWESWFGGPRSMFSKSPMVQSW